MLSVTKNIQSILLTAVLAIILIYLYSILGYMFFSNDFMIATNPMEHFTELRKAGECDAGTCIYVRIELEVLKGLKFHGFGDPLTYVHVHIVV